MVECKVAILLDHEVMFHCNGDITEDKEKMIGRLVAFDGRHDGK